MNIILPENRNVTPVILPCVSVHLNDIEHIDINTSVSQSEYNDGVDVVKEWYKPWVDLDQFPYAYFMGDGITKAIDLTRLEYSDKSWSMLAGDYEWPCAFGKINRKRSIDQLADQVNYLTQPFAGSGNMWTAEQLNLIQGTVVLDMAYISTTSPQCITLPETVDRVFLGASKTFGTAFLRHGWLFSKKEIPSLSLFMHQIKYFSFFNFRAGILLYLKVSTNSQLEQGFDFCNEIIKENPQYMLSGDSWLIANTDVNVGAHLKRGSSYRIPLGLTIQQMLLK